MKCIAYPLNTLGSYKFVVIFARMDGRWLFCKHRLRDTWETAGGHIERGESPLEAARREFYEETGALEFDIAPAFDYWACDEIGERESVGWSNGMVFFAQVKRLGDMPESEMERSALFDTLPEALTYPDITPKIFGFLLAHGDAGWLK